MLIVIDNYDSFTYNLVQALGAQGAQMRVFRNNQTSLDELDSIQPSGLLVSPGPCTPNEAGISMAAIRHFAGRIPILGVCLGHQSIAAAFGGVVKRAPRLMHGKTSEIVHDGKALYQGLDNPFVATRYHSLIVERETLPDDYIPVSETKDQGELMGIRHRTLPIEGVQFHPESFLTREGVRLLANFLDQTRR